VSIVFFGLYLLRAVKCAAVDTRALLAGHIPVVGVGQIVRPKRPASALLRPDRVNQTLPTSPSLLQKYAVARVRRFNDSHPQPDPFEKLLFQLFGRHIQAAGNEFDFGTAHPYISLGRARAAPSTLEALKMQARGIPGNFVIVVIHCIHFTAENAESAEKN
jgi:hypothetical protein